MAIGDVILRTDGKQKLDSNGRVVVKKFCFYGLDSNGELSGCGQTFVPCGSTDSPADCTGTQVSECQSNPVGDFTPTWNITRMCFRSDTGRYYISSAIKGLVDWQASYDGPAGGDFLGVYTLDVESVGPAPATIELFEC